MKLRKRGECMSWLRRSPRYVEPQPKSDEALPYADQLAARMNALDRRRVIGAKDQRQRVDNLVLDDQIMQLRREGLDNGVVIVWDDRRLQYYVFSDASESDVSAFSFVYGRRGSDE